MGRKILFTLTCCIPLLTAMQSEEESLFLRRIADFWEEGEYQIAKSQMEKFLVTYPQSPFSDPLCAALGDLFLREKNFSSALRYYSSVEGDEFIDKVFLNKLHCLFEMQWYTTLAQECEAYLKKKENLQVTYYLAISLYHQCLNSSKDSEALRSLADKALPYFQKIYASPLSTEIAEGYAHLCCLLNDHKTAAQVYSDLAEKKPERKEENLFQVALIQAQSDKERALETFSQIIDLKGKREKEALYNKMVLAFDLKKFDLIFEKAIDQVPEDKKSTMKLFVARAFLEQGKFEKATDHLLKILEQVDDEKTLNAAILCLMDGAYQTKDLPSLDIAIEKMETINKMSPDLCKAYFSKAQILKKQRRLDEARDLLATTLERWPNSAEKKPILFELLHLDYNEKEFDRCYELCQEFLKSFPEEPLTPFVQKYWICSSLELGRENEEGKPQLVQDLQAFLSHPMEKEEKEHWELILSKTLFEQKEFAKALEILKENPSANATLLKALCYRDGQKDLKTFTTLAKQALEQGADLISPGQLHASLYNACIEEGEVDQAADHLFLAFMNKALIKTENLIWLSDYYYEKALEEENNYLFCARAGSLLKRSKELLESEEECKAALHGLAQGEESPLPPLETVICKLARIYSLLGKIDEQIDLLESSSSLNDEGKLLLAEGYSKKGKEDLSLKMFDEILSSSLTLRDPVASSAALQGALLKIGQGEEGPEIAQVLKDLVLQKKLENEPTHLEAALEYIDLLAKNDPQKQLQLLKKTKEDFLKEEDLLAKDYHAAKAKLQRKEKIFQDYISFFDVKIQSLQAKADGSKTDPRSTEEAFRKLLAQTQSATLKKRIEKHLSDES